MSSSHLARASNPVIEHRVSTADVSNKSIVPNVVDLNQITNNQLPARSTSQMENMVNLGGSYNLAQLPKDGAGESKNQLSI